MKRFRIVLALSLLVAMVASGCAVFKKESSLLDMAKSGDFTVDTRVAKPVEIFAPETSGAQLTAVSDDHTAFNAVAELYPGEEMDVRVYIDNPHRENLTGRVLIPLSVRDLQKVRILEVTGGGEIEVTQDRFSEWDEVRSGEYIRTLYQIWKLKVEDTAGETPGNAWITIRLKTLSDEPDFIDVEGILTRIPEWDPL